MSTIPGQDSWRDAGLTSERPDEPVDLRVAPQEDSAEEYEPAAPRPDVDGEATEADVAEQALVVELDEDLDAGPAEGGAPEVTD